MSTMDQQTPVRVVKKVAGHGGHHGGAWKVAYADFVTAMMALFIVLWIVGQSKSVKNAVASYFKDPTATSKTPGAGSGEGNAQSENQKILEQVRDQIRRAISDAPDLKNLADHVKMEVLGEGLRIELMESSGTYFFDVGTATLKPEAAKILAVIAQSVGALPNNVAVEGHTDSRPYSSTRGYTNWELSADRANAARRVLEVNGMRPKQIDEIRGYADSRLKNPQNPYDVTNRRVSIVVKRLKEEESAVKPAADTTSRSGAPEEGK